MAGDTPACQIHHSPPASPIPSLGISYQDLILLVLQVPGAFPIPRIARHRRWGVKSCPFPNLAGASWTSLAEGCDKLHPCIPHCHCQRQGAPPDPKASPQAPTAHGVSLPGSLSAGKPWVGAAGSAIHPSQSPLEMQSPPCIPHHQMKPLRWRIRQDIKSLAFISRHNMFF